MKEYTCSKCGSHDFLLHKNKKGFERRCRLCNRAACAANQRRWRENHSQESRTSSRKLWKDRRALIDNLKSVPCTDCGVQYKPYIMQFDHVRGVKEFGIGKMPRVSLEKLMREIDKCEVVCANCHAERTYQTGAWKSKIEKTG